MQRKIFLQNIEIYTTLYRLTTKDLQQKNILPNHGPLPK